MKIKIQKRLNNESAELLTWSLIIILTLLTVAFVPWYEAENLLQYILIILAIAAIIWYFKSRNLYLESRDKSQKIIENQRELRNRQKTIDLIYENSADGIMILDNEQKIESFSPGMERITGYAKTEALGRNAKSFLKFQGDKNNSLLPDVMFLPRDIKKSPYATNTLVTKDGKVIDIEASYTLISDPKGNHKALAIIRDITYEKSMNERDKEFIAITSHQMNTPLSIIRGYLSMLRNGKAGEINSEQKKYIDEIYESVKKLISITNNLLSISRIEQNKIKVEKSDVNISDMFAKLEKGFAEIEKNPKANLKFELPGNNVVVYADPDKLYQAIFNLIDNSLKYTLDGSITISAEVENNFTTISVSDTGIGIPKDDIEKIGQKFYRAQNAIDVDNKGTGLGMFIVKTIVEKHNGILEISSVKGKGTEIKIKLPNKEVA